MFSQLVAGPIERAARLLPQVEMKRSWSSERFLSAWPLLIWGFFKKIVIADAIALYADKIFMLHTPCWILLAAGTAAFTLQIYCDFSAYTDIARGSARLLGFELSVNFNNPYLAVSPADFWRRWHISFSTWIRDYLYIPLGGSRGTLRQYVAALVITMLLAGLWHGADWRFVVWGLYHALLILSYRILGFSGYWYPKTLWRRWISRLIMLGWIMLGWLIFRSSSLEWLWRIMNTSTFYQTPFNEVVASVVVIGFVGLYIAPLIIMQWANPRTRIGSWIRRGIYGLALCGIIVFSHGVHQDFIYFRF
jgi:D-alanyl-lipoteichoic acid acyltransferase DltB (MBOAT superfamily)